MNEPVTTIDTRFSDPDAVTTPWEETRRVLEAAELFWIVTVRADGCPHATPLVAVWLDVAVEGEAVQVTDEEMLKRLAEVWATKWDGRWQYEIRNGAFYGEGVTIPVFSVISTRVFA